MTNTLKQFWRWVCKTASRLTGSSKGKLPPVRFSAITFQEKAPRNHEITPRQFILVQPGSKPKWVLFRCPCECDQVITLSLQPIHDPHWRISSDHNRSPTLHPSVWQNTPCHSHFWLRDGRIFWCEGTGYPSSYS